jgi:hypothetical protein
MGFKAILGERASARISEVAQGAAGKKTEPKPTYRQAAEQATVSAGEMERKMEIVAKRQMEVMAVAIREGVRTEIAAQVELETKARAGAITWVQEQYAVALRDSEERTEKRLASVEQTAGDTVAKLNAVLEKMELLQGMMAVAVGKMEEGCEKMSKMAPGAAPADQRLSGMAAASQKKQMSAATGTAPADPQPTGTAPAQGGAVLDGDGKMMDCDDENAAVAAAQEVEKRKRADTIEEEPGKQVGEGQVPPSSVQKPSALARDEKGAPGEKKARVSDEQNGSTETGGNGEGDGQ